MTDLSFDQEALWARINRLERRVHLLMSIMIPTGGAVAGLVALTIMLRLFGWQVYGSMLVAIPVFLAVTFWLYVKLGLIR